MMRRLLTSAAFTLLALLSHTTFAMDKLTIKASAIDATTAWQLIDADSNVTVAVNQARREGNWRIALVRFAPLMASLPSFASQPTRYLHVACRCKYNRFLALAEGTHPNSQSADEWNDTAPAEADWDSKAQLVAADSGKNRTIFEAVCGQPLAPQ